MTEDEKIDRILNPKCSRDYHLSVDVNSLTEKNKARILAAVGMRRINDK